MPEQAIESAFLEEFERGFDEWAESRREQFLEDAQTALSRCESPIESRLLGAMRWGGFGWNGWGYGDSVRLVIAFDPSVRERTDDVYIVPQATFGSHRVDFAIYFGDLLGGHVLVVVECDGHEFHEKTKEQAARDKRRDRELAAEGGVVLRFTGSEIFRDASSCVSQIGEAAASLIDERLHLSGKVEGPRRSARRLPPFKSEK